MANNALYNLKHAIVTSHHFSHIAAGPSFISQRIPFLSQLGSICKMLFPQGSLLCLFPAFSQPLSTHPSGLYLNVIFFEKPFQYNLSTYSVRSLSPWYVCNTQAHSFTRSVDICLPHCTVSFLGILSALFMVLSSAPNT